MSPEYSLIEVLVAMAIFAIASLSLSAGAIAVIRVGHVSDRLTQATIPAQDKLEEFRAEFERLRDGSDTPQAGQVSFVRSWQVSFESPETGVARIDVTVSWSDPQNCVTPARFIPEPDIVE